MAAAKGKKAAPGTLRVTQVRSEIGYNERQRATLRGLGLGRPHCSADLADTPAVRGMIDKVKHLVQVEEGR